jgi:hypothetical protein
MFDSADKPLDRRRWWVSWVDLIGSCLATDVFELAVLLLPDPDNMKLPVH